MSLGGNTLRKVRTAIRHAEAHLERLRGIEAELLGSSLGELSNKEMSPGQMKEWWNALAEEVGLPRLRAWTKLRQGHYKARMKDGLWNNEEIEHRIRTLRPFAFEWLNLDWLLKSQTNLAKLLEGNYSHDPERDATVRSNLPAISETRRQIDEMFLEPEEEKP